MLDRNQPGQPLLYLSPYSHTSIIMSDSSYTAQIDAAIAFARPFHEAREPGYFDDHVMAVYREVCRHNSSITVRIAALFHDLVEDTDCTLGMIQEKFGYGVRWFVDSVTDELGPSRKIRKIRTYHKIRRSREAVLIKLCDRIDNLRRCMRDPNRKFADMYVNEDYSFQCALWSPDDYQIIWQDIFDLIEILTRRSTADQLMSRSA